MRSTPLLVLLLLTAAGAAGAQARPRTQSLRPEIPREYRPPAGKCRIWLDGVAPARQPAPTDCQTALRQNPPNGTVIFGPPRAEEDPERFERRQTPPTPTKTPEKREPARDTTRPPPRRPEPTRTPTPAPTPERRRPTQPPDPDRPRPADPDRPRPADPDRPSRPGTPDRPAMERP